ncbi:hypothetical protein B4U79_18514 [Dinothrombium tinctorium]|uniref:Uncharacterized protein n=1 Tax=Dinothrombium tinctorium TaxID=1965070 RepID=A0A443QDV7_9ACAR|nr:hypothetical protein B4U79_18587 [Dinothrombium tinctorium]RWS02201.1 hypothetical protein B4U79_18515 [Dinothrombium tinctorium]RWS02202.1 hypothetical protein B4U79_18514 [Dinothrombium tinctorium]
MVITKDFLCVFSLLCFGDHPMNDNGCPSNCECNEGEVKSVACNTKLDIESDFLFVNKWTTVAFKELTQVTSKQRKDFVLKTDNLIIDNYKEVNLLKSTKTTLIVQPKLLTVTNSHNFLHSSLIKIKPEKLEKLHFENVDFRESLYQPIMALNEKTLSNILSKNLKSLYLIDCNIDYVNSKALKKFSTLTTLSLRKNRIKTPLEDNWFDTKFKKLRILDISHNQIEKIDEKIFKIEWESIAHS